MRYKNFLAVTVILAILFLFSVLVTNKTLAAEPSQHLNLLDSGSAQLQLAQSDTSILSPPSPEKPTATTGVQGRIMTRGFPQGDPKAGAKFFKSMRCGSCHGETGMGQGPAAKALKVKASDWTEKTAMSKLTDEYLKAIIMKGGTAIAKSNRMPAYSKKLKPAALEDLVAYIRSLAK